MSAGCTARKKNSITELFPPALQTAFRQQFGTGAGGNTAGPCSLAALCHASLSLSLCLSTVQVAASS